MRQCALEALKSEPFPANIRELKNTVKRALVERQGGEILTEFKPAAAEAGAGKAAEAEEAAGDATADPIAQLPTNLHEAEDAVVERAFEQTAGNISAAARILGVDRFKLCRRLGRK